MTDYPQEMNEIHHRKKKRRQRTTMRVAQKGRTIKLGNLYVYMGTDDDKKSYREA